jgi:ribosomal protein L19
VQWKKHPELSTGKFFTFKHIHDDTRVRDKKKCRNQESRNVIVREPNSGLKSTNYTIKNVKEIVIEDCKLTVLDVEIHCNKTRTPWCEC